VHFLPEAKRMSQEHIWGDWLKAHVSRTMNKHNFQAVRINISNARGRSSQGKHRGKQPRQPIGDPMTKTLTKPTAFPGLQRIAPETIEKHEMEQALRDAQYALDIQLHDLRTEFLHREGKLRQEYLDRVAEITA
jgi:hypothetical protein